MNLPKHAELWLPAYLRDRTRHRTGRGARKSPAKRLWVALTDHYEPMGANATLAQGQALVAHWERRWPEIAAAAPRDSQDCPPCFTFFYPQEEYRREILDTLATLTRTGTTDVEIHIHHDNDTASGFTRKMRDYIRCLHEDHGLLHTHRGRLVFGFIHGNWALANSRPDGRWCGVDNEVELLRDLGCYADFTMPSVPSATQSRIVNQIYWTTGDPARRRSFDQGVKASVGGGMQGDLLMVSGPLGVRWGGRLLPRLETGELAHYDPPASARVDRWLRLAPRLGDDLFLKLYGHSARADNARALLGEGSDPGALAGMFRDLHRAARQQNLELHWVSAYGMFRAIDDLIHTGAAASIEEREPAQVSRG